MTALISRRVALHIALSATAAGLAPALLPAPARAQEPGSRPLLGAIRWDAWYVPGSGPTEAVRKSLSPQQYHWRAPFFATQCNTTEICLPKGNQTLIDLEIAQADAAGLDYWAFVAYGDASDLSRALHLYLSSTRRKRVKFAMFSELAKLGKAGAPSAMLSEHLNLMKRPEYLRVMGDRPVYFIGFITEKVIRDNWSDAAGLKRQILEFKQSARAAGLGEPYVVLASVASPIQDFDFGADALSAYAIAGSVPAAPYSALARVSEDTWNGRSHLRMQVVPTVMAGWDRRPRVEHPMPWEPKSTSDSAIQLYYERPKPEEFVSHLAAAERYISNQPPERRSPLVLIYAWNENDEGGWLIPDMSCNAPLLGGLQRHRGMPPERFRCK